MKKNTLGDLNGYLFEQMERLNNEELKGEELKEEMERARTIGGVAKTIIENANLVLHAEKFRDEKLDYKRQTPDMLEG